MNESIDSLLMRLPDPAPPPALLASVMARIEREPNRMTMATCARNGKMNDHDRPAWVWAVVGIAVVIGLTVYRWLTAPESLDVISSRIGPGRLEQMPVKAAEVLLLATALWLFLVGLFAPLARHKRWTRRSPAT